MQIKNTTESMTKLLNNKQFRHGSLFAFFSFLNSGISFLLLLVFAQYIAPAEYGYLSLFATITTIFSILIPLTTNAYFTRSYFTAPKETLQRIMSSVLLVSSAVSLLFFVLILCFSSVSFEFIGVAPEYQLLGLVICFFQIFITLRLETWRLEEKPVRYGILTVGIVLLSGVLALFFVIQLNMSWLGRVYSQLLIAGLFFVVSVLLLIKDGYITRIKPTGKIIKDALSYGLPLVPHLISFWIRQSLDRNIINAFLGVTQVGYFGFAYNVNNIILMIGTAFNATNSVYLFKSLSNIDGNESEVKHRLRKQIKMMSVFFLVVSFIIWVGCYSLIPVFFSQYSPSIKYLFPLVAAGFFQCLYLLFVNFLFFYKKTKKIMSITVSVSIFHLLLSFAFTRFGAMYTAYIALFTNFLIFFLIFIYSNKYVKFNLKRLKQLIRNLMLKNALLSQIYFRRVEIKNKANQKKYALFYNNQRNVDIFQYTELSTPQEFVRFHYQLDCNFYGFFQVLQDYAQMPINPKISCEHGFCYSSFVALRHLPAPDLNKVITFGDYRGDLLKEKGIDSIKIGPYIHYAKPLLEDVAFIELKKKLGRVLLVFPCHSIVGAIRNYDISLFVNYIESIKSEFDTVLVCMYWKDINLGRDKFYTDKGYKIVTAGHVYNTNFLPRLKSIIELADMTISNDIGTHIGYCLYLNKPHYIFPQIIEFDITVSKEEINSITQEQWQETADFRSKITKLFENYSLEITREQKNFIGHLFGFEYIRDPSTVRELIR
ncbi:polysaccharide biosynthesis protein [Candidatus Symbiothrix dinenymphae]|nr:polysaccharide biosynthesis protein [Candidatus Symbiothrix dinenymphae]